MLNSVELEEFKILYEKQKQLEKQLKPLKDAMKKEMSNDGLKEYEYGDIKFTLTETERTTVDKDGLLIFIGKKKLGPNYVKMTMAPDVERLSQEVGTKISEEDYNKYVKISMVKTLRVK